MKEPETGKIYCLIRTVEAEERKVKVCRRVRMLRLEEDQVVLDRGDGTRSRMAREEFERMAKEE